MSEKEDEEFFLAAVGKGWRITIPIEVRRSLDLKEGSLLRVTVHKKKGDKGK